MIAPYARVKSIIVFDNLDAMFETITRDSSRMGQQLFHAIRHSPVRTKRGWRFIGQSGPWRFYENGNGSACDNVRFLKRQLRTPDPLPTDVY